MVEAKKIMKAESKEKSAGEKLLSAACKAYGIAPKFVLAWEYYPDEKRVCVVTVGGAKVEYWQGNEVEKLDPVRVDGVPRKKPRHVAGKKKS